MAPKRKSSNKIVRDIDFSKYKVSDLKLECQQRNLETSGKKKDLIDRINACENKHSGGKQVKKEEEEEIKEKLSIKDKLNALAAEENKIKTFQVDSNCPRYRSGQVYDDFDCMLNQTNIGANNNKFYVIQLIQDGGRFFVWNRWGRVGETGQSAMKGPFGDVDSACNEFKKKFKNKTKNNWDDRSDFKPATGKYVLLEMDANEEDGNEQMEEKLAQLDSVDGPSLKENKKKVTRPCTLDKPTQNLMKYIFDNDMFKEAMADMNIDVKKMPLGKLGKAQIAKGFEVLEEIEEHLKRSKTDLQQLTSQFYTLIPHNFGRNRPPVIDNLEVLQQKMEMLMVLGDIEIAQDLQKVKIKEEQAEVDDPLDINYGLLKCDLKCIDGNDDIYKIIQTYIEMTNPNKSIKLLDVWEVKRENEDARFAEHKTLRNRKLLWHGTNVAVVVAILKSGLRIMPHSGGRVGQGIYFASEHSKSAAYVGRARDNTGIMFLNEVALGEQNIITMDDPSLRAAPTGYDSVLAQGRTEPDPVKDVTIQLDDNDVIVPQGTPIRTTTTNTNFSQSEYLVYKESQCGIKYLLKMKF